MGGRGLPFLLNCEAFPRVHKIVLAFSASKLYLDGSLAVSGGEWEARTNQDDRLRPGSGVSNLRRCVSRGSPDVAKNAIPAIDLEGVMIMNCSAIEMIS